MGEPSRLVTFMYMAMNVACVVSIVVLNKILFQEYKFNFPNLLMAIHFAFTTVCLWVAVHVCGMVEVKRAPFHELLKLSLSQVGSVAFVNFSLLYNTMTLYQVLKLLNIPFICMLEWGFWNLSYSPQVLASLFVILLGIGVATVTELEFSLPGFIHGLLATVATALYQILAQNKQKEYSISASQLLYHQAPLSTVFLGLLALVFDKLSDLREFPFTTGSTMLLISTGFIAFGVNLSVFLILGRASPVTYQVVGHFKTCLVVFFGFTALGQKLDPKNLCGILIALVGMVWYTHLKTPSRPSGKQVTPPVVTPTANDKSDTELPDVATATSPKGTSV